MAILVFFGGRSSERLVSVASAQNIIRHLQGQAEPWFINPQGEVVACTETELLEHTQAFEKAFLPKSAPRFKNFEEACVAFSNQNPKPVFFLAFHGQDGEDGTIQRILEKNRIPFTGSGSEASRKAFDKVLTKKIAIEAGVRVARQEILAATSDGEQIRSQLESALSHFKKLALKPVADGSSIGLHILDLQSELKNIAKALAAENRAYLAEEFLVGTEVTVGVLDNGKNLQALPPSEVALKQDANFDYLAKYLGKGADEITPARISAEQTLAVQKVALTMHRALGCAGYSRTDLILASDGPVLLETNTLPGLTAASFIPQQLAAAQISFKDFLWNEISRASGSIR